MNDLFVRQRTDARRRHTHDPGDLSAVLNRTLVFSVPARYDLQMSREIRFELDVDAPADIVWGVVSDMSRYVEWNPFVIRASSTCEVGAPIRMKVRLFPWFAQSQTEEVTEFRAPERICSLGEPGSRSVSRIAQSR